MNQIKSRVVAAHEQGVFLTMFIALALVAAFAVAMSLAVPAGTWTHDFLFRRSFVQWVLLCAFSFGLVYLVRRMPAMLRERSAMGDLENGDRAPAPNTFAGRRWMSLKGAADSQKAPPTGSYARTLAEQDEAELEAVYRIPGDVVQILPLIGFFGTVFGLSHGLYQSFLATGGTTTKDFAKAIAIAFDNTLLGLGLTVVLFVLQSVMRKREEATLLRLNLKANDALAPAPQAAEADGIKSAIHQLRSSLEEQSRAMKELGEELRRSCRVVEAPAKELFASIQVHTAEAAKTVIAAVAQAQLKQFDQFAAAVGPRLEEQAGKLLTVVSEHAAALSQSAAPLRADLAGISGKLDGLANTAKSASEQLAALAASSPRGQWEELAGAISQLGRELQQRDESAAIKAGLGTLATTAQSISGQVEQIAQRAESPQLAAILSEVKAVLLFLQRADSVFRTQAHALQENNENAAAALEQSRQTAKALADLGTKLEAVPQERQTVVEVALAIKELAAALAQRDSAALAQLEASLANHSRRLNEAIRRPRAFRFVEAPEPSDGDGAPHDK
jgi:biopolymer transport protein ExbB/TolQ